MKLKAWPLPLNQLVMVAACAAAHGGQAAAAEKPTEAPAAEQFRADAAKSLSLIGDDGPRIVSVTAHEITIADAPRKLCTGMTHPNFVDNAAFQKYVEALVVINKANAQNKPIKIRVVRSEDTLCRPVNPPRPAPSAASQ